MLARALAVILTLLASLSSAPALAQAGFGRAEVTVTVAGSSAPAALARIVISGTLTAFAYADERGIARFEHLPPGSYRGRVTKPGFRPADIPPFTIAIDQTTAIDVRLASVSQLKQIGSVSVREGGGDIRGVGANGPLQAIARSLGDALGSGPALDNSSAVRGTSPLDSVLVDGESVASSGVLLDGVPLGGFGGIRPAIDPGLFAGASVSEQAQLGSPATVDFAGFSPTIAWQSALRAVEASAGGASLRFSERGSAGRLGIAYVHAEERDAGPLDGSSFADASGAFFPHHEATRVAGDYLRLQYPFASGALARLTLVGSNGAADLTCATFTALAPCSFGPGARRSSGQSVTGLSFSAPVGLLTVFAQGFVNDQRDALDERARVVAGSARPFATTATSRTAGGTLALSATLARHTLTASALTATTTGTAGETVGLSGGAPFTLAVPFTAPYATFTLRDDLRASRRLRLSAQAGAESASGTATRNARLSAQFLAAAHDTVRAGYGGGMRAVAPPPPVRTADVADLQFVCASGTALGTGVGDYGATATRSEAQLGFEHRAGDDRLSLDLYRNVVHGGYVSAYVPVEADPVFAGSGFAATADALLHAPLACGAGAPPLAPDRIALLEPVATGRRVYQGFRVAAELHRAKGLVIEPYFASQAATVTSLSGAGVALGSTLLRGGQLPGVPLQRYGVTLDRHTGRGTDVLLNLQGVAKNNAANLPSFATLSLGLRTETPHGVLQLGVRNAFNTLAPRFAGAGVPLARLGAAPLATVATPLRPFEIDVRYATLIGRRTEGSSSALEDRADGGESTLSFVPLPLPERPPAEPFAPLTTETSCDPVRLSQARALLAALEREREAIERARATDGAYPASFPAAQSDGITVAYARFGASYAFELRFPELAGHAAGRNRLIPFLGCVAVHVAAADAVRTKGGYVPADAQPGTTYVLFTPALGIYLYASGTLATGPDTRTAPPLPTTPPADPFALRADTACGANVRPLAEHLLGTLRAYVNGGPSGPQPDGWKITPRIATAGRWLELRVTDPLAIDGLARCATIAAGTLAEIRARGLDAAPFPAFGYAPQLGLYRIR